MAAMTRLALLIVALTACGDDGVNVVPDAPLPIDAPDIDAPTAGTVSLTITSGSTPVEGIDVYFQNADSSLVAKVVTGADGVASATMEPGGFVTAVDPFANLNGIPYNELKTFAGVKPGDQLRLGGGRDSVAVTFTVVLPPDPEGLAAEYELNSTCGSSNFASPGSAGNPGGVVTFTNCGAMADMLVVTRDQAGVPIEWFYAPNVAVAADATVDLSSSTYQAITDATFSYQNVPAAFPGLSMQNTLLTSRGQLYGVGSGGELTAGAATLTAKRPLVPGTTSAVFTMTATGQAALTAHGVYAWAPIAATVTQDLAGVLLPEYTQAPTVTASTQSLGWTSTGSTQPDFVIAEVATLREEPAQLWGWEIVAPSSGTTLAFPVLPTEIARFNFQATDEHFVEELINAKVAGGYDAVRAGLLAIDGIDTFITAGSGRLVFAVLAEQEVNPVRPKQPRRTRPAFLRATR